MKLIAPNEDGVFTFKVEDAGREIIFLNSHVVVANIQENHCSSHTRTSAGCPDCSAIALFHTIADDDFEKINKKLTKGPATLPGSIHPLIIEPRNPSPKVQLITQQMARMLAVFFSGASKQAAEAAGKKAKEFTKIELTDEEKIAIVAYLAIDWTTIVDSSAMILAAAYQAGADEALQQLSITSPDMVKEINEDAANYAKNRAAEMVGKKYVDNELEDDAHAKYVIAETTKDDLLDVVQEASTDNLSISEMEDRIRIAGTFSDLRAQFIAKNENAVAVAKGSLDVWRKSHIITRVSVVLSPLHPIYDECDKHAEGSPYDIDKVPVIPAHPYCMCRYEAAEVIE